MLSTCFRARDRAGSVPHLLLSLALLAACAGDPIIPPGETGLSGVATAKVAQARTIEFGDFALYLPADAPEPRAVLVALGGPDTRGFVTGNSFGAPPPVEPLLQLQGAEFRALAAEQKIAILGTSRAAMANSATSDQVIRAALQEAAGLSGHPVLAELPLLIYGISGGTPEAGGLAARDPARTVGLFLKVPVSAEAVGGSAAAGVPTFVWQAQNDIFVNNAAVQTSVTANRAGGAFWGLVVEPGAPHFTVSPANRQMTRDWMAEILGMRLRGASGQPLRPVGATTGWIGDPATGALTPAGAFPGTPAAGTSWLPSKAVAELWRSAGGY